MNKSAAKKQRAILRQDVAGSIHAVWTSLSSHLGDTVRTKEGNPLWQSECCLDYAKVLLTLCRVQHHLAALDFKPLVESREFKPRRNLAQSYGLIRRVRR